MSFQMVQLTNIALILFDYLICAPCTMFTLSVPELFEHCVASDGCVTGNKYCSTDAT